MANASYSNSKGPQHEDMVSRGKVIVDNSIAAGQVLFTGSSVVLKARPPSPDREIELALGGNYVYKDEAAYGATDEMSYMGSPKGTDGYPRSKLRSGLLNS